MSVSVRDNPTRLRYEAYDGETLAAFTQYRLKAGQIAFVHTETDPAFAGKGVAAQLVRDALDDVRGRHLDVLPFCDYVRKFIAENPAYVDLVPEHRRGRFGLDSTP